MPTTPRGDTPAERPLPAWFLPPPGGWTIDDMERIPPEAPRMELIDGTREPRYVPITIARERLKLDVPFAMDIDVQALTARR